MMAFIQANEMYIITSPDEVVNFMTLASMLHVEIKKPIDKVVVTINRGVEIQGLDVVENFEVLFDHTEIVDFSLVLIADNPNLEQVARAVRFIREVYDYRIAVIQGMKLTSIG